MPDLTDARGWARAATALALSIGAVALTAAPAQADIPAGWDGAFSDTYSRTSTGSWGSNYTLTGATTKAGVSGTAAFAKLDKGKSLTATVKDVRVADVEVDTTMAVAAASATTYDVFHGWTARHQADGSGYRARLRVTSAGTVNLGIARVNGTVDTWLKGINLPASLTSGPAIGGELQVSGTSPVTVRARAWTAGASKPAWQVVHTDSSAGRISQAGSVAVRSYVEDSTGPVTVSTDDLSVATSAVADAAPSPAAPARGSAPVGSASYPVPAGAVIVSPTGSDSNPGTLSSPLKTAKAAVVRAPAGGTVVLRGGVYHEAVKVEVGKSITLQNYPREAVWFDGSMVLPDWTKAGNQWIRRGWTTDFSSMMGHDAAFKERFIGTNPMAADPDLLFIDGVAQKQVATAGEVTAGRFYVSDAGNTIVIGSDPTGKEVRASDISQAINVNGPNSVIQGIGVRRYANGYEKGGAIKMSNVGGIIRDVVIRDVATMGLSVSNRDKLIDRVTVRRAGQLGIAGYHNDNSVVRNSIASDNNTEGFKDAPVAGGMKFCAARTITISNNEASNNLGTGIWFDVSAYDMTIVGNDTNGNSKYGIEVEVSSQGIVANNQATGGEAGITIFDSGNLKVFNNDVGGSTQAGIKLIQDERRQAAIGSFTEARDPRYLNVVDPKMPWLNENIQVANNVFGNGGAFQLFALDGKTDRAVDRWNLTVNGNLFNPRPTNDRSDHGGVGQGRPPDRGTL